MKHIDRPTGAAGLALASVYQLAPSILVPRGRKLVINRETTPGGYWEGERIYSGRVSDQVVFRVGVPDSGEGTHALQLWLKAHKVKSYTYEAA